MDLYGDEKLGSLYQKTHRVGKAGRAKDCIRLPIRMWRIHVAYKSAD